MGIDDVTESVVTPRPVVIHYHLFKNAGSSIDRALKENFGVTWAETESDHRLQPALVAEFLSENPWVSALSSHTATLPLPSVDGIDILPIVMLRHPVDRIRSVYEFERRQDVDGIGANTAKGMTMKAFVAWRLDRFTEMKDRSFVNFQVERMALGSDEGSELERAQATIARLPFVGVVEAFDQSLERLEVLMRERFPKVRLHAYRQNVSPSAKGMLDEKLSAFRGHIGDDLFERLLEANHEDMVIWEAARESYQQDVVDVDTATGAPAAAGMPGSE